MNEKKVKNCKSITQDNQIVPKSDTSSHGHLSFQQLQDLPTNQLYIGVNIQRFLANAYLLCTF